MHVLPHTAWPTCVKARQAQILILCLAILPGLAAVEERFDQLGGKHFYPSTDQPVGFLGDGTAYFPHATPVTTWREGEIVRQKMAIQEQRKSVNKSVRVIAADSKATNVVWKTAMPAWGKAQPVVVGDLIFVLAEPYHLLCVSAHDGRIWWQRSLRPMDMDSYEGKQADALDEVLLTCKAIHVVTNSFRSLFSAKQKIAIPAERLQRMIEHITWLQKRQDFTRTALAGIAGFEKLTDSMDKADAAFKELVEAPAEKRQETLYTHLQLLARYSSWYNNAIGTLLKVPTNSSWHGYVGWTMATPVSDGQHVYVRLGQGQTACLDFTGKIIWSKRYHKDAAHLVVQHLPSPLLFQNMLICAHTDALRALDKNTGDVIWEVPGLAPVARSWNVGTHAFMPFKKADGSIRHLLVTTQGFIIDPKTGERLATLTPAKDKRLGGPSIIIRDHHIYWGNATDGYYGPIQIFAVTEQEDGSITVTDHGKLAGHRCDYLAPTRFGDDHVLVKGKVWNAHTGASVAKMGDKFPFLNAHPLATKKLVIWPAGGPDNEQTRRVRADRHSYGDFLVVDLSDPTAPKEISRDNLLGGADIPHINWVERLLPKLCDRTDINKVRFSVNLVPADFGGQNSSGMWASGNRLFIRGNTHLYCIGDPNQDYDWDPNTRPAQVAVPTVASE